jgi:poly(A) polymerase
MVGGGVLDRVIPGPVAIDRLARLLALAPEADQLLRLGALLRPPPADPSPVTNIARRWRLSSRDAARLEAIAGTALPALEAPGPERRRELYRLGPALYADLIRLAAADVGEKAARALATALAEAELWRSPKLPLDGDDLIAEGVRPGPQLGKILAAVETWWLERDFAPDRAACLAYARTLIAAPTTAARAPGDREADH